MKKSVFKSVFAIACVVAASVNGFKAYEQNDNNLSATNMLLAENVEALSNEDGFLEDLWNSVKDAAKDYYNSKIYAARLVTVTTQNGGNASAGAPVYGIVIGIGGSASTTVSYQCNCCVNGNTYAHCSEIPNQCSKKICSM